jgi:Fe-S-cluster containining protein
MKEGVFIEKYLQEDQEGDFVLQRTPCAFLGEDNYCSIYEDRPSDCRRFPYTDEDVLVKRVPLTLKNTSFCPITYVVIERLMEAIPKP